MRIALAFDIFAGLTALLIVGLLAGFNIGLVQFGITGTRITGLGNTREYFDLNSALNRVQWKCGTAVAGVVVALFVPKLKGSIGEGPNHSNFSDRSSSEQKFRNFR